MLWKSGTGWESRYGSHDGGICTGESYKSIVK